jgi:predicted SnoaL-like aldol condensation-catalyzing enzyme
MMRTFRQTVWAVALVLAASVAPAAAQSKTMTAEEQANLKTALDWWRQVIQARHVELAPQYQDENYIQHNPGISTGRDAFVKVFGARPVVNPIPEKMAVPPVIQFAKGDYVVIVWEREAKDPKDDTKTYKYNFFDVIRMQNGKVMEHWDSVFKNPPRADQPPPPPVVPGIGPVPVSPKMSAEEQKNLDIANTEFKDILQYGHVELASKVMAPGYIQHNPNVPGGRDGFVAFFKDRAMPEPIKAEWKNKPELVIVSGNLVLYVMERYSTDPVDPSKVYKWNWFDMVRVDDGMIQEHWDMAMKTPPPASVPKPAGVKFYSN